MMPITAVFQMLALLVLLVLTPLSSRALTIEPVTSSGGITAWLMRDATLPLVAIDFAFLGAGGLADPRHQAGLGKLMATTLDEGAGEWDSQAFQAKINAHSLGLSFNVSSDDFHGRLYSLNRYIDLASDLMQAALNQPRFDSEPVARMQAQLSSSAKRQLSQPAAIANRYLWHRHYPSHPYHGPIFGNAETLARLTPADLRRRWQNGLAQDNLIVSVVGDITPTTLKPLLDKLFGALPRQANLPEKIVPKSAYFGQFEWLPYAANQTSGVFILPSLPRAHPDFYPLFLVNHIVGGGGFSSRLTQEVREERGLVYSIYSHLISMRDDQMIYGGFATNNETAGETVRLIRQHWQQAAKGDFSQAEIDKAKAYLTGSYGLRFTSSSEIARYMTSLQSEKLGIDFIQQRNDLIAAVQLKDVNRVAQTYIQPDKLSILLVGQPQDIAGAVKGAVKQDFTPIR